MLAVAREGRKLLEEDADSRTARATARAEGARARRGRWRVRRAAPVQAARLRCARCAFAPRFTFGRGPATARAPRVCRGPTRAHINIKKLGIDLVTRSGPRDLRRCFTPH